MTISILALFLTLFSAAIHAACTKAQLRANISVSINVNPVSVKAGGDHGFMDKVIVSAPLSVEGIALTAMELTKGEVAAFWMPLAFNEIDGNAVAEFAGYKSAIEHFEISVTYENAQCRISSQSMLYARNTVTQFGKGHEKRAERL